MRINQRIGIGTVQWGQGYGLGSKNGSVPIDDLDRIVKKALEENVSCIDTSQNYGIAESLIGQYVKGAIPVVTKITVMADKTKLVDAYRDLHISINRSKKNLKTKQLESFLVHNPDFLKSNNVQVYIDALKKLKDNNVVKKIGISVYNEQEITSAIKLMSPDIIQVPINVFDQRLLKNGLLNEIKNNNCEIHARSIFLQGLLLLRCSELNNFFKPIATKIQNWQDFCKKENVSCTTAALNFIKNIDQVDVAIIGINSYQQFEQNLSNYKKDFNFDSSPFAIDNDRFIDPRKWVFS